ncbi:MAG: hypothetical protein EBS59_09580, partial [Verrucomicrobia bacterium]|nr:hypothetical protein [Verrucomicrobiota bacterium]
MALFDSPADGENGATAGFVLNLPLPLSSSWDIAADVNLPNGWETTEAEIGLSLEPMFGPSDTVETHSIRGNYLSLDLNRDTEPSEEGANNIRRSAYVGDVEQDDLKEVLVDDSFVTARLRLVYLSDDKTLSAWVKTNPNLGWVRLGSPLDLNPGNANSLAQKWSLSTGSSLMLVLHAYAEGGTGGRTISLDNLSITAPSALAYPGMRSTYVSGLFGTNTVGFYDGYPDNEGNVERHGFLYNGSNWTQLRPTNSLRSEARGIYSNRIVGSFTDSNERRRGYLLTNGVYTLLDYPGSTETRAFGVDGDRIVGDYRDTSSVRRAFLRTGNSWTNFSFPGAVSTSARGISGNRIVGNYTDLSGGAKGFILEGTNWTSLSYSNLIFSPVNPAQTWSANY